MDSRSNSAAPEWAAAYLRFAAWTQDEFRNLLCGLPPVPPAHPPERTRQEINDGFVRDELRRIEADRHVRDAVLAGHLKHRELPSERLLEKITPHVTVEESETLRSAIAHDLACNRAYRFQTGPAITWAVSRRDVFPDFPFTLEDLSRVPAAPASSTANEMEPGGVAEPNFRPGAPSPLAPTSFPNRATWLERQLGERKWTAHELKLHGGPDSRTTMKILNGEPVKGTVLTRLAQGLSESAPVSRREIPDD